MLAGYIGASIFYTLNSLASGFSSARAGLKSNENWFRRICYCGGSDISGLWSIIIMLDDVISCDYDSSLVLPSVSVSVSVSILF